MTQSNQVFSFGIANEVDAKMTTIALCCTVVFVNLFEYGTSLVEHAIGHSYVYQRMLQRIYMELMSTGFTSILIAMYRAADPSLQATQLLLSMDFSGYLIFFITIFHVIHGIYIIGLSLITAKDYDQLHSYSNLTLLKSYASEIKPSWIYKFLFATQFSPIYLTTIRKQFEFKILFSLFRHTYWLPVNFHYGLYLSQCLERYSERIMTIGPTGWAFLLVVIVCNYLRTTFGSSDIYNCNLSSSNDENHQDKSHERHRCDWLQLRLFCAYGVFMATYILVVFIMGRIYTLRLIREAGVTTSGEEYEEYIFLEESTQLKIDNQITAIIQRPSENSPPSLSPASSSSGLPAGRKRTMSFATLKSNIQKMLMRESEEKNHSSRQSNVSIAPTPVNNVGDDRRAAFVSSTLPTTKRRPIQSFILSGKKNDPENGNNLSVVDQFKLKRMERDHGRSTGMISNQLSGLLAKSVKTNRESMKLSEDFSGIYLFKSPMLYFRAVEIAIVLNSLYLSLWLINFISVCARVSSSPRWQLVMILPLLVAVPVIGEIVKTASLLSAIAELNVSVMGSVLEEMEARKSVLTELKINIEKSLSAENGFSPKTLYTLFRAQCEEGAADELNKSQFRSFLTSLRLPYSDNRFRRTFRALDDIHCGYVTYDALYSAVFPEEAELENRRVRNASIEAHLLKSASAHFSKSTLQENQHLRSQSAPSCISATHTHRHGHLSPHCEDEADGESPQTLRSPSPVYEVDKLLELPTVSNPALTVSVSHESRDEKQHESKMTEKLIPTKTNFLQGLFSRANRVEESKSPPPPQQSNISLNDVIEEIVEFDNSAENQPLSIEGRNPLSMERVRIDSYHSSDDQE